MENNWLERTELLLGNEKVSQLQSKHILIVGLGGVGAYAAEMIGRAGVGNMTIVDGDVISNTNINRQLPALTSTVGQSKVNLIGARLKDINPSIELSIVNEFVEIEQIEQILETKFDYVVDAIDTLTPKIHLICHTLEKGYPLISSMGAGGKMDPSKVLVSNLEDSYNCKLARMLRKRLRKHGVKGGFPVVFSSEEMNPTAMIITEEERYKKSNVGTISYMPAIFGIYCASKVIRDLSSL